MEEDLQRYEIECAHLDKRSNCAEIKYKFGVRHWFKGFLKDNFEDISPSTITRALEHLTVWYTNYQGELTITVSDNEKGFERIYVFRKDDFSSPLVTIKKNW